MTTRREIPSGIYQIKNLVNGRIYVGSAVNVTKRWQGHRHDLANNQHHSVLLQRSWRKYGAVAFEFSILEKVEHKERLVEREQHWIDRLRCFDSSLGFNVDRVAGSRLGSKHSEETRRRISAVQIGRVASDETRKKMSDTRKGRVMSEEFCEKNSKRMTGNKLWLGRKHSEESKEKISIGGKGNQRMLGKKHSLETKLKMSAASLGRKKSAAHCAAMSAAARARNAKQ